MTQELFNHEGREDHEEPAGVRETTGREARLCRASHLPPVAASSPSAFMTFMTIMVKGS